MSCNEKLCFDCRHVFGRRDLASCHRRACTVDVIYGPQRRVTTCEFERSRIWRWLGFNTCGPDGRYFEPVARHDDTPPPPRPTR